MNTDFYERPELVNGQTFFNGFVSFAVIFVAVLIVGWLIDRRVSQYEDVRDIADSNNDDYFDKIKDFQDDFQ